MPNIPEIPRPKTSFEVIGKRIRFLYVDEFGGEGRLVAVEMERCAVCGVKREKEGGV